MRRVLPMILVGLGAFLLVAGLMIRFYVYPTLAVVPVDQNSVTHLEAKDATIFDAEQVAERRTDLSVQNATRGNVVETQKAQEKDENVRVWASVTSIRTADDAVWNRSVSQTAFHAKSAQAINCCNNFVQESKDERTAVERRGLVFKFPFNVQKKDYEIWDDSLGDTVTAKFVKETKYKGLPVYVFQSEIPETVVGTRDVPGKLVGQPNTPTVTADEVYSDKLIQYIEPITGGPVDREDHMKRVLRGPKGEFTAIEAVMTYTDEQANQSVADMKKQAPALGMMRSTIPVVLGLLGLLLLAGGLLLHRRGQTATAKSAYEDDDDI